MGDGGHALEADITVPGVASGRLVIESRPTGVRKSERSTLESG
jgi:hypothetical protein